MQAARSWWIFLGVFGLVAFAIAGAIAPESNIGFKDAGAVIAFATMMALGIERTIEIGWTLVDNTKVLGAYWPFSLVGPQITKIEEETNKILDPIFTQAQSALEQARTVAGDNQARLGQIDSELAKLQATQTEMLGKVTQAQSLAPGSTRIANVSGAASSMSRAVANALDVAADGVEGTRTALSQAQMIATSALEAVGTFTDNPARRIGSLLIGAALGAVAAGFVGVNLFSAILESGNPTLLNGSVGVVVTGIVIGLGTGPTHELVKGLQAFKRSRQVEAVTPPELGSEGGIVADAGGTPVVLAGRRVMIRSTG